MRNRIRVFRQRNGLTLRELAESVGTTPQSVSRLETGNMTLSTEWLERFASALAVHPVDLLEGPGARDIAMLGHVAKDGAVREGRDTFLTIDIPAESPVAVKLDAPLGDYRSGEVLIGDKINGEDFTKAQGCDCIVETHSGQIALRNALTPPSGAHGVNGGSALWLVPLSGAPQQGEAISTMEARWVAPLILRLSYIT